MRAWLLAVLLVAGCNALLGIEPGVHEAPTPDGDGSAGDARTNVRTEDGLNAAPANDAGATPGACVDLENNPRHCGACNHDCGPGPCNKSVCQPGVLVTDPDGPEVLLVTPQHAIYQTTKGDLRRVSIASGAAETIFAAGIAPGGLGQNMVIIGDHFYFADRLRKRVARCPLAGPCTPETIIGAFERPYSLATANGDLYVADGIVGSSILRCKAPPCASQEVFARDEAGITRVAASATDVAWSTQTFAGAASIRTKPIDSRSARTLFADPNAGLLGLTSLVLGKRHVYAVFQTELIAYSLDTPGQEFLAEVGGTETLSLVGTDFWYGDFGKGDIFRRALSALPTQASTLVVDSTPSLRALEKHATGIYWLSNDRVMRVVR